LLGVAFQNFALRIKKTINEVIVVVKAVQWTGNSIRLIDQTKLPLETLYLDITETHVLVDAINRLAVRGAPALGVCGAYGVALAMLQSEKNGWNPEQQDVAIDSIRNARPTAVNLAWAVDEVRPFVEQGIDSVVKAAVAIEAADIAANLQIAKLGADWILANTPDRPLRVITHCNTGALAASGRGTALGVIQELADRGKIELVYADETRPLLQGARLTAWELDQAGINHVIQADGAAASTILRGMADFAIIGADRIAANGDSANKIGSVSVALACHAAGIPFLVAAPVSTVDLNTLTGAEIEIELRDGSEITHLAGVQTAPNNSRGFNPAFDVTPAKYIVAIFTEAQVIEIAKGQTPISELS
jgi:methylthioribose-1-phosphate isomerase